MELLPGFVFRFKIFPFLKTHILPLYENGLRKESSYLVLSPDEEENLRQFSKLFSGRNFEIKNELDIQTTNILFETAEKYVSIFSPVFNKLVVNENEKRKILDKFNHEMRQNVLHLLS